MSATSQRPDRIEHPAAWQGEELFSRDDWMYELDAEAIDEIKTGNVPKPLTERLQDIQGFLENGSGVSLIRGFPVDQFNDSDLIDKFEQLAGLVGTPISQSAAGEKVFSVRNAGLADDDPRARGPNTRKKLSFHTDRCDVIGFLCVKQAKSGGENQVVSSVALYNEINALRPDLMDVLMQPYLYKRHTVDTANELAYIKQPIFSFYKGFFASNFLRVLIDRAYASADTPEMTPLQLEALDFVEEQAARPEMHVTFTQEPGDMLFLNNWVTLHRRTAFEDHQELEQRRHLLRVWLSMPNSRPIDPMFAGNYGATEAGAIRGGMKAR